MKRKKNAAAVRSATVDPDNETVEQKIARLARENAELEKANTVGCIYSHATACGAARWDQRGALATG